MAKDGRGEEGRVQVQYMLGLTRKVRGEAEETDLGGDEVVTQPGPQSPRVQAKNQSEVTSIS